MTDHMEHPPEAQIIAEQNDRFRTSWGADRSVPGQIVMTRGVAELSPVAKAIIVQKVRSFAKFTEDNDPWGDHTFGAFDLDVAGQRHRIFWKIDLYDAEYCMGSEDPSDLTVTRRVLTVLHAHEY